MTDDLVTFLRARLDADERRARGANPDNSDVKAAVYRSPACYSGDVVLVANMTPARVLAEVDAKRRIVKEHADEMVDPCVTMRYPCPTLKMLALPYADHPGHSPEWRPPC